jgi:hypothetical protein
MGQSNPIARHSRQPRKQLSRLRDELKQRLMRNPDYRALIAIERAIAELEEQPAVRAESPKPPKKKLTIIRAATQVLKAQVQPLPVHDLLSFLRAIGVKFNGKHPESSLSVSLSRDNRFRTVRYRGKRCWWLSHRSIPDRDLAAQAGGDIRLAH